jgi:hypothetical protein
VKALSNNFIAVYASNCDHLSTQMHVPWEIDIMYGEIEASELVNRSFVAQINIKI